MPIILRGNRIVTSQENTNAQHTRSENNFIYCFFPLCNLNALLFISSLYLMKKFSLKQYSLEITMRETKWN
jgi:hypothetical protein